MGEKKSWSKMTFPKKRIICAVLLSFGLWRIEHTIKTKAPDPDKTKTNDRRPQSHFNLEAGKMGLDLETHELGKNVSVTGSHKVIWAWADFKA